jgi:hypothetical protein
MFDLTPELVEYVEQAARKHNTDISGSYFRKNRFSLLGLIPA